METPTWHPHLPIQPVYHQGITLKTWHSVVVFADGDEAPFLLATELVLRAPRSVDGQGFLSVSEDRPIGTYAAER